MWEKSWTRQAVNAVPTPTTGPPRQGQGRAPVSQHGRAALTKSEGIRSGLGSAYGRNHWRTLAGGFRRGEQGTASARASSRGGGPRPARLVADRARPRGTQRLRRSSRAPRLTAEGGERVRHAIGSDPPPPHPRPTVATASANAARGRCGSSARPSAGQSGPEPQPTPEPDPEDEDRLPGASRTEQPGPCQSRLQWAWAGHHQDNARQASRYTRERTGRTGRTGGTGGTGRNGRPGSAALASCGHDS
jgi:hypothetical protein